MLFNSFEFLLFFPLVVAIYFALGPRYRKLFLLAASYYFYASWRAEYLLLIIFSTGVDYWCGLKMGALESKKARRPFLILSLISNLGLLFAFKYFNFFNDSIRTVLEAFDVSYMVPAFQVLLPVGISFYTFQTLSYSFDVYQGKKDPESSLLTFALYVSFFPQLVAGPIERSTHLLPQFHRVHSFDHVRIVSGLRLALWGLFKKVVVADRLAAYVDQIYAQPELYHGWPAIVATYFFAFQIYCDFSGYTDMAIGTSRILGFDLMKNFRQPYNARSIREFWHRWHISLTTWFRDYLYIPLGGNRVNRARWFVNILIVFIVSGIWHGANWTFVVWGALHGAYLVTALITQPLRDRLWDKLAIMSGQSTSVTRVRNALSLLITFHLVLLAWVFFRASSVSDAVQILSGMLSPGGTLSSIAVPGFGPKELLLSVFVIVLLEFGHLVERNDQLLQAVTRSRWRRWSVYYGIFAAILLLGQFGDQQFIYFQF